ncbi:MAG: hypothetical protein AAFQ87_01930 [Bacteroidota bacterium]
MQDNKAIHLLRTFSAWELRSLDDFLRSPFFNKQEKIISLWEILHPLSPELDDPVLERKSLFAQIWPDTDYHERRLRYLLTDFARLIEAFWAYKDWDSKPLQREENLMWVYHQRQLLKYKQQIRHRQGKQLARENILSADLLQRRFQLAEYDLLTQNDQFSQLRSVQEVLDSLDEMYLLRHLRYACEGVNRARIFAESPQTPLTPLLIEVLGTEAGQRISNPLIEAYRLAYLMLTNPTESEPAYFALKSILWEETPWARLDVEALHSLALNFCIGRLNAGEEAFRQETFEMYRHSLEQEILLDQNGVLADNHFKNLVAMGTRLQEYDWTESFIETFGQRLSPATADNAYRYNLAYLLIAQKQYSRVLRLLAQVEFTNVFYQLGAKTILARVYYETADYESLLMLLKNFRAYLKREKSLSQQQRKLYQNFSRILQLMTRYQAGERVPRSGIEKALQQHAEMAARSWILEKAALL